jgi:hypothetical protein
MVSTDVDSERLREVWFQSTFCQLLVVRLAHISQTL